LRAYSTAHTFLVCGIITVSKLTLCVLAYLVKSCRQDSIFSFFFSLSLPPTLNLFLSDSELRMSRLKPQTSCWQYRNHLDSGRDEKQAILMLRGNLFWGVSDV
jgi:hypothetical protein